MKFPKVLDNSKNVRQGGKKIEKAIRKQIARWEILTQPQQ